MIEAVGKSWRNPNLYEVFSSLKQQTEVLKKRAAVMEEEGLWIICLPSWKEGSKVGEREACFGNLCQDHALMTVV